MNNKQEKQQSSGRLWTTDHTVTKNEFLKKSPWVARFRIKDLKKTLKREISLEVYAMINQ
jgi:hypothetical protein